MVKTAYSRLDEENGDPVVVEKGMEANAIQKLIELSERMNNGDRTITD